MKTKNYPSFLIFIVLLFICSHFSVHAQNAQDTNYLPKIDISSLNGFGPFVLGKSRSFLITADQLPSNTSKVNFRIIDFKGKPINSSFTASGQNMQNAFWEFNSDTIDFPLSPKLNVEVQYKTDSVANYYIPFLVYPDTIWLQASNGWGPFISNHYTLSDTLWQPAPEQYNTFTATDLPPRTETVKFTIFSADSIPLDSLIVNAEAGKYLDSAAFEGVRMDQLPVSTSFVEIAVFAEGGPETGILRSKELDIIPQQPILKCITKQETWIDTMPLFIQNHTYGQALQFDTATYAEVQNGPGIPTWDFYTPRYQGPYSLDIEYEYTIEAWIRFEWDSITSDWVYMEIMAVDSLWGITLGAVSAFPQNRTLTFHSYAGGDYMNLVTVELPLDTRSRWHHFAYSYSYNKAKKNRSVKVYWDGEPLSSFQVNEENFSSLISSGLYKRNMKTKALRFGYKRDPEMPNANLATAFDEVRIWQYCRTDEEIKKYYNQRVFQDQSLVGYWNFDDRRNRLKIISDLSYKNNTGRLTHNAKFIPQDMDTEHFSDQLIISSSDAQTDSIRFFFSDINGTPHYEKTLTCTNAQAELRIDLSSLSSSVNQLNIYEFTQGLDSGFCTTYPLNILPPSPQPTPKYNWGTFYKSDESFPQLYNSILVSDFPSGTNKVQLGLEKDGQNYDVKTYTNNSIPYGYSLKLNGTDNYIETTQKIDVPTNGSISIWFKTSSTKGGKLICFSETQSGANSSRNERNIIMKPDGTIQFILNSDITLYAEHAYNDGEWHHVEASFGLMSVDLKMDGCNVDHAWTGYLESYQGYWIIGRDYSGKRFNLEGINQYFQGSLSQIYIDKQEKSTSKFLLKLDEGKGTVINDSHGDNNGTLKGSSQNWSKSQNGISFLQWDGNMINKDEGTYTFFAHVFYEGGADTGMYYPLGNFSIQKPFTGCEFSYYFTNTLGFFNEGVLLLNEMQGSTNYTGQNGAGWKKDFVRCVYLTPDHFIIRKEMYTYTEPNGEFTFSFDMGDAPVGSYISVQLGSINNQDTNVSQKFSIPIYTNQIIAPTMTGDLGPFQQAIAPGVMAQTNTFTITTEHINDLDTIVGTFRDNKDREIARVNAKKINDTTWHLTYDMSKLSPPSSYLTVAYYLGDDPHPALIEGPYVITIDKTRPRWFDFLSDDEFHNIEEKGDEVTFSIETTLGKNNDVVATNSFSIPKGVPFMGGTTFHTGNTTVEAYLKYKISEELLEIDGEPNFHREIFKFKIGPPEIVNLDFQMKQNDFYFLDDNNDLIADQNFASALDLTFSIKRLIDNPITKIIKLYKDLRIKDWSEVKPVGVTANFTVSPTIGYASRLHYITDTIKGGWGSYGELKIDANPEHREEYNKSASYNFVYAGLNNELSIGVTFADGLVDVYAALALGIYAGMGKSYIDIPKHDWHFIMSGLVQLYFRVYLTALWDWYEVDLYGPKAIHRWSVGEDNMTNCIPPFESKKHIETNSESIASLDRLDPVGWYSKMPLPSPQHSMSLSDKHRVFAWVEPGNVIGERELCVQYFDKNEAKFDKKHMIYSNMHAIQKPFAEMLNEHTIVCTWMQSRHNPESFYNQNPDSTDIDDIIEGIAKSTDIWYAVYDTESESLLTSGPIEDNMDGLHTGRAEAKPTITVLSDKQVLVCWQVANLETSQSDIWYTTIENIDGQWIESTPAPLAEPGGIQTNLKLTTPEPGYALAVWKNFDQNSFMGNSLLYSVFDGIEWTQPKEAVSKEAHIEVNYYDMDFNGEYGALIYTTYTDDTSQTMDENLALIEWDAAEREWSINESILYSDSMNHIELPCIDIRNDGETAIGFKKSRPGLYDAHQRISQVDLLLGNLDNNLPDWEHIKANPFVCDTSKQLLELNISFAKGDTLLIMGQEFVMSATNVHYTPTNAIRIGNPLMNLVLRSVQIEDNYSIKDVDERGYFTAINDDLITYKDFVLKQNHPNPCKNATTIGFYLPENDHILLELFDNQGRKVNTFLDQQLEPGEYEIELNTEHLPSGAYIYTLSTSHSRKSLSMMISK